MTTAHELDTAVLHCLRIKGRATPGAIAAALSAEEAAVSRALELALGAGLATRRAGRLAGWLLTPAGRAWWEEHSAAERAGLAASQRGELTDLYDTRFLALNRRFKLLCARRQTSGGPGGTVTDEAVAAELTELHEEAAAVLDGLGAPLPRLSRYEPRLRAALDRLRAGDASALLQPFTDSYHDVWLELHEDLLLLLGREREEDDA
ncbi:hypothetical protein ACTWP5_31465 [Streptomyces sp. 4N509B]|uniref:hypothetical protein n=1 Tax=Streptomyces sp. 4N509B TaxID=3457413 RepID=UPI003FD035A0